MSHRALAVLVATVGAGLFLLVGPSLYNTWFLQAEPQRSYVAPDSHRPEIAATPIPTDTPFARAQAVSAAADEIRPGPVVIDYGHLNQVNLANFQALADALARRGLATRLWVSSVDPNTVQNFTDFPDQSKELSEQLEDASALIVVSPFFLWTPQEIAVAERFAADGGRLLLISDPDVMGDSAVIMNLLAEPFGVVFNEDYLYDTEQNDENFTHFFNDFLDVETAGAGDVADAASQLAGARIAFYGGRSIGGDVTALARSAPTTLSSMVGGVTGFTTAALGGVEGRGTAGRVLTLSDFDVFSEPNAVRHDNRRLVEFVAAFLAGAQRTQTVADFPQYLGRDVYLLFGGNGALDAETLLTGARLQRRLEETGRTLTLTGREALTRTLGLTGEERFAEALPAPAAESAFSRSPALTATATITAPIEDLIYLASYEAAEEHAGLLTSLGITLVTELITPTVTPGPLFTPTPTPTPALPAVTPGSTATPLPGNPTPLPRTQATPIVTPAPVPIVPVTSTVTAPITATLTATLSATITATFTATPGAPVTVTPPFTMTLAATATDTITGPLLPNLQAPISGTLTPTETPTPLPTPVEVTFLVSEDGLRLLAGETALVLQHTLPDGHRFIAALGHDAHGIDAAAQRLLANDFADCIVGAAVTWCPVAAAGAAPSAGTSSATTPTPAASPGATPAPDATRPASAPRTGILLVDDDELAAEGEASEADRWLQALTGAGHQPELWSTSGQGRPDADTLKRYAWVIWSNGGYAEAQLDINYLDPLFAYLNDGGRFTVSSLMPFFGMGIDPASPARDVVTDDDVPPLILGVPAGPTTLEGGGGTVAPLTEPTGDDSFEVALRRGPASQNAGAPIFIAASDAGDPAATGARLSVLGMSLGWLPRDVGDPLVRNLATWMMEP